MPSEHSGIKNISILILFLLLLQHILTSHLTFNIINIHITKKELTCIALNFTSTILFSTLTYMAKPQYRHLFWFLILPFTVLNYKIVSQMPSIIIRCWGIMFYIELLLKNISFVAENTSCSINEYIYFLFVPTLCFEKTYKKKPRNYKMILFKIITAVCSAYIFLFTKHNYIKPYLHKLIQLEGIKFLNVYLQYTVSVIICWFCIFLFYFDGYLSTIAEILAYDVPLYNDWWNSTSLNEFWRKWNLPFHYFVKKYIYTPICCYGIVDAKTLDKRTINQNKLYARNFGVKTFDARKLYAKKPSTKALNAETLKLRNINAKKSDARILCARTLCFLFSAAIHEYGFYVVVGKFGGYMFVCMVFQAFIIFEMGNVMFWGVFCVIGQPIVLYLYYRMVYGDMIVTKIVNMLYNVFQDIVL